MAFLSAGERRILAYLCDTLISTRAWAEGYDGMEETEEPLDFPYVVIPRALELAGILEIALDRVTDDTAKSQLKLFFAMIEQPLFNAVTVGKAQPFTLLTSEDRAALLRAWATSRFELARKSFQSLKRLGMFLAYSYMKDEQPNPAWVSVGYQGPPPRDADPTPRPIQPLAIDRDTTLSADVLIIGSGAGGGVVAGELSAAGYDVLVVEKGDYYADADYSGRELESTERMFEKYGSLTTADTGMLVLAGATLGGGTTFNWSASLRTPDTVLREWATEYGFRDATSPAYAASLDAVFERSHVNSDTPHNAMNRAIADGCTALGYDVDVIPRNVKGCEECGLCNFGCRYGAKQGTLKTYLQDAYQRGARIVVRGAVERVTQANGTATGAEMAVTDPDGKQHRVTIRAKAVVVAAGSVHTPALLIRSGLHNTNVGGNLRLHPVTAIYSVFDQPIRGWEGAPMTRICNEFADLDGRGYGVRLESAPIHPGIAALSIPWQSARQHKATLCKLAHMSNMIVITRDRYGGRVTVDKRGQPVLRYRVHPHDARHMMRGLIESLRIHRAAGAYEISSPHAKRLLWRDPARGTGADGAFHDFEAFLKAVEAQGFQPNAYALFSAHQMASCRIGGSTALGALDPTGESYEVRNLFVADGSALPTATGVNPMMSIMGLAHYIAQQIKTKVSA